MAYSYENELNQLKEAQKKSAIADLENTRNQTLSDLTAEQQKNTANFGTQKNAANVQNKMSARNFQEYLASTGRANSGLSSQAKLQSDNNLANQLNAIRGSENSALADIERRRTNANNTYNSGLASANANIEANYIQNLLDQRAKAAELAQQEKEFNESVRQFNEQMKYNYANLYSNFSRGSGGGGGSASNNSDDDYISFTGNTKTNNKTTKNNKTNKKKSNTASKVLKTVGAVADVYNTVTNPFYAVAKIGSAAYNKLKGKK